MVRKVLQDLDPLRNRLCHIVISLVDRIVVLIRLVWRANADVTATAESARRKGAVVVVSVGGSMPYAHAQVMHAVILP